MSRNWTTRPIIDNNRWRPAHNRGGETKKGATKAPFLIGPELEAENQVAKRPRR